VEDALPGIGTVVPTVVAASLVVSKTAWAASPVVVGTALATSVASSVVVALVASFRRHLAVEETTRMRAAHP
jgi:hypothetical protein